MYEVKLKNEVYLVEKNGEQTKVNGEIISMDSVKIGENAFHLLVDKQSLTMEIVSWDPSTKKLQIKLNDRLAELIVSTEQDLLLEKMGLKQTKGNLLTEIKAPMPGLILDIPIKEGDTVEKGEVLIVLEAMKMENSIKSSQSGTIRKILVDTGQGVEKNQVMIQF
ncbi:acetyl-CoA carboxylase biotin carboxyl carrier protein subunit [Lunatibacter salilacus]|uniref:acetyl-CoA carboxylase biotin carboxyl carrier protein subunit n=1 Tax=Lunatibacter salilacus TaxID=2483804 RepID=UPI00131B77E5|nr:acetyl-CoA carboxylase biotin carboxyl carrier protein subunit [Lunatibacter salilacus]